MLLSYRDPNFWKTFQAEHWQPRIPTVIRNPFQGSLFSETSLLRAMKTFQAGLQSGDARLRYMFSLGGKKAQHRGALKKIFQQENASMEQLEATCTRLFPEKSFGMMVNNLQAIDSDLWHGVSAFLQDAHPWVDFPVALSVVDLFWGRYSHSFLGLHKDTQEIFAFVMRGEKTILAWPFDYFTSRVPGVNAGMRFFQTDIPVDYRKYRKDALVLNAKPGDIIYWPSEYWHIAEGDPGKWTAMLSLGLFLPHYADPAGLKAQLRFRQQMLGPDAAGQSSLRSGDVTLATEGPEDAQRLRRATGFGFRFGGPVTKDFLRKPAAKVAAATYRKKTACLLLWRRETKQKRITISTNGYSVSVPLKARTLAVLEALATQQTVTAKPARAKTPVTYQASYWNLGGELRNRRTVSSRDEVSWLLDWLLSVQAIEVAPLTA